MESHEVPPEMTYRQSVPILARLWQDAVRVVYGDVLKLQPKEFGQLKVLAQRFEDLTPDLMSWAVSNWGKFSLKAKLNSGLPSVPPKPHVGFLLAHMADAINLMVNSVRKRNTKTEADIAWLKKVDRWCERVKQRCESEDD
jgi:hypothetical protein